MMMMTMLKIAITVTESRDSNVKKTMMVMMAMMLTLTYLQLRHFGGAAFQLHCILTPPCHHHRNHYIIFLALQVP